MGGGKGFDFGHGLLDGLGSADERRIIPIKKFDPEPGNVGKLAVEPHHDEAEDNVAEEVALLGARGGLYGGAVVEEEVGLVAVEKPHQFEKFWHVGGDEFQHEVAVDAVEGVAEIEEHYDFPGLLALGGEVPHGVNAGLVPAAKDA